MTSRSSSLPPGTPTGPPRTQQAPSSSSDGATLGDGARDRPGWRGAIVPGPALVGLWRSPAPLGGLDALRPLPELPGDRDRDPLPLLFSPPSSFSLLFRPSFVSPASHRLLVWFSSVASRATTWIPFSSPRVCVASAHPIRTTRLKNLPCGQAPGGPDLGEKQAVIFGEYEPVHKTGRRKQSSTAPCEECASMRGVRCQPSSCLKKAVMVAGSCLLAGEASRSSPSRAPKLPASYQASYMLPMQSPSLSPHVNKEIHCYGCMFQGWQIQEADFFHPDEPLTVPTHRSQSPINTVQDR